MSAPENTNECRCAECASIHAEFISQFGRWPHMSHEEGQALAQRRRENEASWDRMMADRPEPRS